jgi:hypothetical protein
MCSSKLVLVFAVAAFAANLSCKNTDCGPGTIDKSGVCTPADETVGTAMCGSGTVLEGDVCVAALPPTECDPTTTMPMVGSDGTVTCIGTGGGGCSAPFACPKPTTGKQTICGQLYDFENNTKLQGANPMGAQCMGSASSGPCAVQIVPFDAVMFANNPTGTPPLASDPVYIDDCGRYRVPNITLGNGPFVLLGIDDAGMTFGPGGTTVTTGVALPNQPNVAVPNEEAFVVPATTVGEWDTTGGSNTPTLQQGVYVAVFRQHVCAQNDAMCTANDPFATQGSVQFVKNGVVQPSSYFATETVHDHVDGTATATSINGTALFTGAVVTDGPIYSGLGGISDTANCKWESHPAASLPGTVFFQIYRPVNSGVTTTCTQ